MSRLLGSGFGHNPPVGVAFQFLLVGRLAIELNGRYSASILTTALAQPGQLQSFEARKTGRLERQVTHTKADLGCHHCWDSSLARAVKFVMKDAIEVVTNPIACGDNKGEPSCNQEISFAG